MENSTGKYLNSFLQNFVIKSNGVKSSEPTCAVVCCVTLKIRMTSHSCTHCLPGITAFKVALTNDFVDLCEVLYSDSVRKCSCWISLKQEKTYVTSLEGKPYVTSLEGKTHRKATIESNVLTAFSSIRKYSKKRYPAIFLERFQCFVI